MENIRALLIKPYKEPLLVSIKNDLNTLQGLVGGYIQVTRPIMHKDDTAAVVCNEEGKLLRLPLNRPLFDDNGEVYDILNGDFLIVDAQPDAEEFGSLSWEQVEMYTRLYGLNDD